MGDIITLGRKLERAMERRSQTTFDPGEAASLGWLLGILDYPELPQPDHPHSVIYILRAGEDGPIKIGRTTDLSSRIMRLQTGNHLALRLLCSFPGDKVGEGKLHRHFRRERLSGEWFEPSARLLWFACVTSHAA